MQCYVKSSENIIQEISLQYGQLMRLEVCIQLVRNRAMVHWGLIVIQGFKNNFLYVFINSERKSWSQGVRFKWISLLRLTRRERIKSAPRSRLKDQSLIKMLKVVLSKLS